VKKQMSRSLGWNSMTSDMAGRCCRHGKAVTLW